MPFEHISFFTFFCGFDFTFFLIFFQILVFITQIIDFLYQVFDRFF